MLPLVPSYIGFLTGMTLAEMTGRRRSALLHALLFVAGFSLVFMLLGATATALGRALKYYQVWLQRIGGVLIILFGLVCLGVIRSDFLMQERRLHLERQAARVISDRCWWGWRSRPGGRRASGRCWARSSGSPRPRAISRAGLLLLGAYSAGLAVPFLLAAWRSSVPRLVPAVPAVSAVGDAGERGTAGARGDPDGHRRVHPAGGLAAGVHARRSLRRTALEGQG